MSYNLLVREFCDNVDIIYKVSSIGCADNENLESRVCYFNQNEELLYTLELVINGENDKPKKIESNIDDNANVCGFFIKNEKTKTTFVYNKKDNEIKYLDEKGTRLFSKKISDEILNELYNKKSGSEKLNILNPMLRLSDSKLKEGKGMFMSESIAALIQYSNVIAVASSEQNQSLDFLVGKSCETEKDYAVFLLSAIEGEHLIFGICQLDNKFNKMVDSDKTVHIFDSAPREDDAKTYDYLLNGKNFNDVELSNKVDIQNKGWICAHLAVESARAVLQYENYEQVCENAQLGNLSEKLVFPKKFSELKNFLNEKGLIIQLKAISKLDLRLRENNVGKEYKTFGQIYEHGKNPDSDTHSKKKLQTEMGPQGQKQSERTIFIDEQKRYNKLLETHSLVQSYYWRNKVKKSKSMPNLPKVTRTILD